MRKLTINIIRASGRFAYQNSSFFELILKKIQMFFKKLIKSCFMIFFWFVIITSWMISFNDLGILSGSQKLMDYFGCFKTETHGFICSHNLRDAKSGLSKNLGIGKRPFYTKLLNHSSTKINHPFYSSVSQINRIHRIHSGKLKCFTLLFSNWLFMIHFWQFVFN